MVCDFFLILYSNVLGILVTNHPSAKQCLRLDYYYVNQLETVFFIDLGQILESFNYSTQNTIFSPNLFKYSIKCGFFANLPLVQGYLTKATHSVSQFNCNNLRIRNLMVTSYVYCVVVNKKVITLSCVANFRAP